MKILHFIVLISFAFFVPNLQAQIYGCTDPLASNYNSSATINNGSCLYNATTVTPTSTFNLAGSLSETSGLIKWDNRVWTHNDNTDINIYALDTLNGNLIQPFALNGTVNIDWEEISQDDDYIYLGDIGNNANGNRTNLKILRIDKNSVLANSLVIDTINFSYSNQDNFTPAGANNTDFDCEAFIVSADSIFLFSKQWISNKTSVYAVSKTPGTYVANLKTTYNVEGLITGAAYLEPENLVVLCGYSNLVQPFTYLLYDFTGSDYFGGNKRKIKISLPFHQVEGIATSNGLKYFISNEKLSQPPINVAQKFHILDLSPYLSGYINNLYNSVDIKSQNDGLIYPNPTNDFLTIKTGLLSIPLDYCFINQSGCTVLKGILTVENQGVDISVLKTGSYILQLGENNTESFKVIKR